MSVKVMSVEKGSPAAKAGVKADDLLVSINGNEIMDVLDFRFYQNEKRLLLLVERNGKVKKLKIKIVFSTMLLLSTVAITAFFGVYLITKNNIRIF